MVENWLSDYQWPGGLSKEVTFQLSLEGIAGAGGGFLKEEMWEIPAFCLLY